MQMFKSNDLVVFDRKLNLQLEFKAKQEDTRTEFFRKPNFSFEGDKIIWFSGKYSFSVVDLKDLTCTELENMLPRSNAGTVPEPLFSVADFKDKKILTYYNFEEEGVFVYHQGEQAEPLMYLASEVLENCAQVKALDLSKDKKLVYAAGALEDHRAFITVLDFDQSFQIVASKVISEAPCTCINSLALSPNQTDLIFAGTDGPFLVLGLNETSKRMDLLKIIDIKVHSKFPL